MKISIKRVYDETCDSDGKRILVDRLWPRGVKKQDAKIDLWPKEITPSTGLRKWYAHDPALWEEFQTRYRQELKLQLQGLESIRAMAEKENVTLITAAKSEHYNHVIVLKKVLEQG